MQKEKWNIKGEKKSRATDHQLSQGRKQIWKTGERRKRKKRRRKRIHALKETRI